MTRSAIALAILETLSEYKEAGRVKHPRQIVTKSCSRQFAYDVLERLGRPMDVSAIEYCNLTGLSGAGQEDELYYENTLSESGVKVPPGVTADLVNASGLGWFGTHTFLRWESPAGLSFFDAEVPQGVDSPFSLPFAKRLLRDATKKRFIGSLIKYSGVQPGIWPLRRFGGGNTFRRGGRPLPSRSNR